MPYLVAVLLSFLVQALVGLGVGFTSYTIVLPQLMSLISSKLSGMPVDVVHAIGYFRLDVFISLVLSGASAGLASRVSFVKR